MSHASRDLNESHQYISRPASMSRIYGLKINTKVPTPEKSFLRTEATQYEISFQPKYQSNEENFEPSAYKTENSQRGGEKVLKNTL